MKNFYLFIVCVSLVFSKSNGSTVSLKTTETTSEKHISFSESITKISLENDVGDVVIKKGDSFGCTAKKVKFHKQCQLDFKVKDQTLYIKAGRKSSKDCRIDFNIETPKRCDVHINLGVGNSMIKHANSLTLDVGAGDLTAVGLKNLTANLGVGDVKVSDIEDKVLVRLGSGNIILAYEALKTTPAIDVKVGAGTVKVLLPSNATFVPNLLIPPVVVAVKNDFSRKKSLPNLKVTIEMGVGEIALQKQ